MATPPAKQPTGDRGQDPTDFAGAAARIEANPLGRLMYGQRELFHSNLIGWFFDQLPEAADAVFRPLTGPGTHTGRFVERERQHLDLVMHWTDRAPLVIENKVFSIPGPQQLDDYAAVESNWTPAPALVLLSVSTPDFDLGAWTHLSYAALAESILDALPAITSYEVETMRRYAALVTDLHELVSAVDVRSDAESVWLPSELLDVISSSQMRAALHKARAQRVAHRINQAIPGLEQPAGSGMSNATPLVESFEYVHTRGLHVHLGWQLQGTQFRRAAVYHDPLLHGHSAEARAQRERISRAHPEFFTFPDSLPQAPGGRKEFNHFAPNFVYRYVKTRTLTIGELLDAASDVHQELLGLSSDLEESTRPAHAVRSAP